MRGTIKKIGLEGGVWALITEKGRSVELIDPPDALKKSGLKVEIEGDSPGADVSIGMMGASIRVRSFKIL